MFRRSLLRSTLVAPAYAVALTTTAFAGLIVQTTPALDTGTGFGTVPNVLTVQATGTESGCVTYSGGSVITGAAACQDGR